MQRRKQPFSRKAGAAVLLGVVALAGPVAGDDRKVHKAFHPHWWDSAPYSCRKDGGWSVCHAGGWEPPGLVAGAGGENVPVMADAFVKGNREGIGITTTIGRKPGSLSVRCEGAVISMSPKGRVDSRYAEVRYRYNAMPMSGSLGECLAKPITLMIDAREYRLDSSRLRRALEKARDRL